MIVECDGFGESKNKKGKCAKKAEGEPGECKPIKEKYRDIVPVSNRRVVRAREAAPAGTCGTMRNVVAIGKMARSMTPK